MIESKDNAHRSGGCSMRHPHVRDIVDIALQLTGGNRLAGEATAIMLILNNVFLAGFHVLTGSKVCTDIR